ncbi:MAG: T9SS type A sorting domain-containing protein [Ignavibacteriaceae bacterium]|nr:T9SS type A sorting domain-containing protein [Ignavibacteriaceae bacterium]
MASPLVAGLAALVWSKFPGYNAIQIGEQIRVNCDDIDGSNPSYKNKLGKGRINAYKSLNNINSVSVRLLDVQFTDEAPGGDNDGILEPGETVSIGIAFKNYLSPTSNLSVTLQSKNSYSTIVNGSFNAGAIGTLTEFNNYSSRFTFTISSSTPANTNLSFLLNYSDGSYTDYEWIGAIGNPTYATQAGNDISITITSKGTYGFNDYPNNLQGSGFQYLSGGNNLFEGALILGTSATKISDAARGSDGNTQNSDFSVVKPFVLSIPGQVADVEGTSVFNDNNAGGNKIGITAKLHTYSFAQSPNNNFIILKYTFLNNGSTPVSNLFAGLFFDWDMISSGSGDVVSYDASFNFGRVYHQGGSPDHHIGVALVSSQDFGFYAIKNDGGDGGFSIYDGFTDQEKWNSLSGGVAKPNAGPGDVSNVTSGGPYSIPVGDSITVAFVIAAASNETDLQNSIITARNKYQNIITGVENGKNENLPVHFELSQNYPNPFNPSTRISYSIPQNSLVSLKVYDVLGNEVANLVDAQQSAGRYEVTFDGSNLASGIYLYKIKAGNFTSTKKLVLMK